MDRRPIWGVSEDRLPIARVTMTTKLLGIARCPAVDARPAEELVFVVVADGRSAVEGPLREARKLFASIDYESALEAAAV